MTNKIDYTKLRPIAKMQDPMRFPKVQGQLEKEMKDAYELELNKMLVDITRKLTLFNK
jgi:hypothetical protein